MSIISSCSDFVIIVDAIGIASEKTQEFMGKTIQVGLLG